MLDSEGEHHVLDFLSHGSLEVGREKGASEGFTKEVDAVSLIAQDFLEDEFGGVEDSVDDSMGSLGVEGLVDDSEHGDGGEFVGA